MLTVAALLLVGALGMAGALVGAEELSCDESACDETSSVLCICCPHLPRSVLTPSPTGPGVDHGSFLAGSFAGSFVEPPPDDILHVPKRIS